MIEFVVLSVRNGIVFPSKMTEFILASQSPRRQMLLRNLLDRFIVVESDVEESDLPGEEPSQYVLRLATEKAQSVEKKLKESSIEDVIIIAADTIVLDDDKLLGKPEDARDARKILDRLNGKTHQVLSGITVYKPSVQILNTQVVCSDVPMRDYDDQEIREYINSGDPFDKAGAYAIQNDSFNPAPEFADCYANVMGLPLCHLALLLAETGMDLDRSVADRCQNSINYQCPVFQSILY